MAEKSTRKRKPAAVEPDHVDLGEVFMTATPACDLPVADATYDGIGFYLMRNNAVLPSAATPGSAGWDVSVAFSSDAVTVYDTKNVKTGRHVRGDGKFILRPGERALIPTGLMSSFSPDYVLKIYPRSGRSIKEALTLINAVGIVDSDYRNEIFVAVINQSACVVVIEDGDRIAQFSLELSGATLPVTRLTHAPGSTARNGGFGSSGK